MTQHSGNTSLIPKPLVAEYSKLLMESKEALESSRTELENAVSASLRGPPVSDSRICGCGRLRFGHQFCSFNSTP